MKSLRFFIFFSVAVLFAGCLSSEISPEAQAQIDAANARVEQLITYNTELVDKFNDGTLTSGEFKEAIDENSKALADAKVELEGALGSGASALDLLLYGGLGGVVGRTAVHAAGGLASMVPGPWGLLISTLCTGLLGGSSGKKKKVEVVTQ